MSASGFTPISIYYSTTASAVPLAANLVPGELAINTNDGKLYYEDSSGVVQVLATKSTGSIGGSNTQVQFNNSGSLGGSSSFTWDGTTVTATKFAGALNGTVGATTASTGAFTTLSTSSTTTLSGLTASTALALDASKNVVSVTNTGTGNNVLSASPTLTGTIAGASLSLSSLTSSRVTYAGASGLLTDSANLTYGGSTLQISQTVAGTSQNLNLENASTTGTVSSSLSFTSNGVAKASITSAVYGNGYMAFATNDNTEKMRIDASGNVGIGTSSPTAKLQVVGAEAFRAVDDIAYLSFYNSANSTRSGYIQMQSAGVSSIVVQANQPLTFSTNNTERMRIDSSGNLLVGTTTVGGGKITSSDGAQINAIDNYNGNANITCGSSVDTTGGIYVKFLKSDTSNVGTITRSGSNSVGYNSVSDYRLKTVIGSVTNAGQRIDALEPIEYDWNTGGRAKGFLAHKFSEVYPNSVSGEKDAVDKEGKPIYQTMQASTSEVMADLIAEIQSLRKRITTLENK